MADISAQVSRVYEDGSCEKTVLLACKNATAADTFDVAPWFRIVKRAGAISATGTTVANVTFAGTVLTIPTGPSADGVWVLVVGVAV